ncbi:sulfatase [Cellvibrio sp. BR]|uniref:LTA synthase family protein n=1 Tax=Cellvibrio sp. BR TaxID=1134474 RepID=UPI0002600AF7|nr:LTA synthase family protein [Cellvibrio sp. BR]EIK43004.1 sulfatase [Cellvibrio sp. BR]
MNKKHWLSFGCVTGPYVYLFRMAFLGLVLLSVSRMLLALWQSERVMATGLLADILLQGVRADIILLSLWCVPAVLLLPFLSYWRRLWFPFTFYWAWLGLALIVFIELATPAFLLQFDARPNRLFIEYLRYPKEVFLTLLFGFTTAFIAGTSLTVLLGALLYKVLRVRESHVALWSLRKNIVVWPLVVLALLMGVRSTTDHRPANPAFFAITGDAMVNSLVINSGYSVLYAIYNMKHEARSSEMYGKLSTADMLSRSLDWPWLKNYEFTDKQYPTFHYQRALNSPAKPLNVVIVLQESMGATFVGALGGVGVTPELDKLADEGIWFERLYATGTRSVRGIEAVVAGYPPTPAQSVVKLSKSQRNFTTLASVLKAAGYTTQFIYGGEAHFDNMRSFFTGNGFSQIVDLHQINDPVFVGSWGASDEDLFTTAHQQLTRLHQTGQPFFSLIFTSSNHEPFEFPDGRIALHEEPKAVVNNAVKYADWAMGQFFAKAKQSEYWQDTVFLIVADHDNRVYGNNLIPVEKFHIPGLILGGSVKPKRISELASQIDLAPTLLSLMGVSSCHTMIGRDFIADPNSPGRALLQFDDYFALMEPEKITLLKPDSSAVIAQYNETNETLTLLRPAQAEEQYKALAQVQLPSYLYREQKYGQGQRCAPMAAKAD